MSLASGLKPLADSIRAIPGILGVRPHTVSVVTGSWDGAQMGEGTLTEATLPLTHADGQPPKVQWLNDEQRTVGGGLPEGTVKIGPLTPDFPGGGVALSEFGSQLSAGQTIHLIITGPVHPSGARYKVTDVSGDKATQFMVQAQPVAGS